MLQTKTYCYWETIMQNSMNGSAETYVTNFYGNTLKDLMDHFDMCQLSSKPTPKQSLNNARESTSLVDLVFTNLPSFLLIQQKCRNPSAHLTTCLLLFVSMAVQFNPPALHHYKNNGSTSTSIKIEWLKLSCSMTG